MAASLLNIAIGLLLLGGSAIALISAIGLLRLPDLLTRMHAASKAGAAGSSFLLVALALASSDPAVWIKCAAAIAFFFLTAPVSAHLLAKAALAAGFKPRFLDAQPQPGASQDAKE
jgi:multicomponent Na+:H+ antiporter subunit G